ncbi:MAG TPA: amylo-alpha-1,6-glucosidase, partial [Bacteroidota bacterium]
RIAPGDSLNIAEVIGCCRGNEVKERIALLHMKWRQEVRAYDEFIRGKASKDADFTTGDPEIDRSAVWARALIAANAHYLDGNIVPMPCPAEYNFFFTHDLLLTNLGAVNFDLPRVKSNLLYVASLAKDSVIPHAYYWRDDGFKTEYCEPENWNHLWFVIVSGSYLRHSLDDSTGQVLFPFIEKSVQAILTRLRPDGLMYAYRPDWWDIGHIEGPRTYLTALAVRALREYLFISSFLHRQNSRLVEYEKTADAMQSALLTHLWDAKEDYLTNYNAGKKDYHFYAGSLIASVYGLMDQEHATELVATAEKQLVDDRIGIRIAMPPDFSSDSVVKEFKFAGDEAGPPYSYANGGVWPHGNAWFAMALKDIGKLDESYDFVRRTMTIDGVAKSPNGLPAMYEYRSSDPNSPSFGTIDKPSFLWAGGMYLQVLYRLLAIDENPWNISIRNELPSRCNSVSCSMTFGGLRKLVIRSSSNMPGPLRVDGEVLPSRILPLGLRDKISWESTPTENAAPVLVKANAIVQSVTYESARKQFRCTIYSFDGHKTQFVVDGENPPKRFSVNGRVLKGLKTSRTGKGRTSTTIEFPGSSELQNITLDY